MKTSFKLLLTALLFTACSHNTDLDQTANPTPTPPTPTTPDSINVLKSAGTDGGLNMVFNYDAAGRCISFGEVYPSRYDSVLIYYNAAGKIDRIVRKDGFYSTPASYNITPSFFRYDAQQRLSHVFNKQQTSTIYTIPANYTTTLTNPYDPAVISSYDSLVYDGSNRVTECYLKSNGSGGSPNAAYRYSTFIYRPGGDSSLASGKLYISNGAGGFNMTPYTFNAYGAQRNPYADNFSAATLVAFSDIQGARLPLLPPYFANYVDYPFLQLSRNVCTSFNSPGLHTLSYTLNGQGLVTRAIIGAASTDWVAWNYMKIKKP